MNTPQQRYYRRLIDEGVAPQKVARFNKYLRTLNRSKRSILPLSSLYRIFDEQASERARRGFMAAPGVLRSGALRNRTARQPLPANFLRYVQSSSMTATKGARFAKWYSSLPNTRKQIYGANYQRARENFNRSIGERAGRFAGVYKSQRNLPMINSTVQGFINFKTNNRNKKLRFINYYKRLPSDLKTPNKLERVYTNFNRSAGERTRRAPGAIGERASALRNTLGRRAGERASALRNTLGKKFEVAKMYVKTGPALQNEKLDELSNYYLSNNTKKQFRNYVNRLTLIRKKNKNTKALFNQFFRATGRSGISIGQKEIIKSILGGDNLAEKEAFIKYLESIHPENRKNIGSLYDKFSIKTITPGYIKKVKTAIGLPNNVQGNQALTLNKFIRHIKNKQINNRTTNQQIKSLYNSFTEFDLARKALGTEPNNRFKNILRRTPNGEKNTKNKIRELHRLTQRRNINKNQKTLRINQVSQKIPEKLRPMFINYAKSENFPLNKNLKGNFYKNKKREIITSYMNDPNFINYWLSQPSISNINLKGEYNKRATQNYKRLVLLNAAHKLYRTNQTKIDDFMTYWTSINNFKSQKPLKNTSVLTLGSYKPPTRFQSITQQVINIGKTRREKLGNIVQAAQENPNLVKGFENIPNNSSVVSLENIPVEIPQGRFARGRAYMRRFIGR